MLIGTDRNIFTNGSLVQRRIARLGSEYLKGLDSIVFSMRGHNIKGPQELAPAVHAHPTNSRSRFFYGCDAIRIAKRLPRPDIVSAQDPFETGLVALRIARHFKVPLSVEVHTDFISPSFARSSFLNHLRVMAAGYVLRRANRIYVVSERVKEKIQEKYNLAVPISVLPIYTDTKRFSAVKHSQHPKFKTALLWVGRFEKEKNPILALRALAYARGKGYDAGLTFVGSGRLEKILKKQTHKLDLDEYVEFVGWVQDLASYYANADILLVTSEYEGYGMALVEALSAGVPVLSTGVGIAQEAGAFIADNNYCQSLIVWLEGDRAQGRLKLHSYMSEDEYMAAVKAYYTQ